MTKPSIEPLPKGFITAEDMEEILDPSKRDPETEARRLATLERINERIRQKEENGEPLLLKPGMSFRV
ncbi:hypothetical protein [Deinococcus sp. SL84]|uniref:hypothetical protein n=1 Tax=Deinococcus sp. SL84 TaxID=2994663 RepID=UPI002276B3B2|nr:hypothetical protein [Deinococcus sp. SL84]MCY1703915.1 hypothetical protein [Deinococcus sp. SL84]